MKHSMISIEKFLDCFAWPYGLNMSCLPFHGNILWIIKTLILFVLFCLENKV